MLIDLFVIVHYFDISDYVDSSTIPDIPGTFNFNIPLLPLDPLARYKGALVLDIITELLLPLGIFLGDNPTGLELKSYAFLFTALSHESLTGICTLILAFGVILLALYATFNKFGDDP